MSTCLLISLYFFQICSFPFSLLQFCLLGKGGNRLFSFSLVLIVNVIADCTIKIWDAKLKSELKCTRNTRISNSGIILLPLLFYPKARVESNVEGKCPTESFTTH